MRGPRRLAVIDLGTNSFRLVVFTAHEGHWKRTDEIHEAVRLGEGMGATGVLGEEPMERALATMDVFAHFCRASALHGDEVDAVATSAVRDALNGSVFLARAHERSGLSVRVLSREEEARYGYLAAVNSTTLADGCVLDLGGGSMQLVRVDGRLARDVGSWPLGAVRMSERFLPGRGPVKRRAIEQLREHVAQCLTQAPSLFGAGAGPREAGGGQASDRRLVALGGTVRSLASAAQRAAGLPSEGVQGQVISRTALAQLIDTLAALPVEERGNVPGIKAVRADLVLAGAVVLHAVLEHGGFAGIEVTEAGLREGVFFARQLEGDPPMFEDVRRSSVLNLAGQYHADHAHTEHVARLALALFDELADAGLHGGDAIERELLWAACVLHDIGMSVDYDDHHKHSRYLILNAGLPGYTPSEVAVIAQAARYHRKGRPEAGELAALFTPEDDRRLERCAVLLRLGEDVERSRDQLVRSIEVTVSGEEVALSLVADDEATVARWAAARETELFARAFARRLVVT